MSRHAIVKRAKIRRCREAIDGACYAASCWYPDALGAYTMTIRGTDQYGMGTFEVIEVDRIEGVVLTTQNRYTAFRGAWVKFSRHNRLQHLRAMTTPAVLAAFN